MPIDILVCIVYNWIKEKRKVVLLMKKIRTIIGIIGVLLVLWIMVSYIDISAHNSPFTPDFKDYSSWNFFTIFFWKKKVDKSQPCGGATLFINCLQKTTWQIASFMV